MHLNHIKNHFVCMSRIRVPYFPRAEQDYSKLSEYCHIECNLLSKIIISSEVPPHMDATTWTNTACNWRKMSINGANTENWQLYCQCTKVFFKVFQKISIQYIVDTFGFCTVLKLHVYMCCVFAHYIPWPVYVRCCLLYFCSFVLH